MGEDWTLTRTFASEQGEVRWDVLGDGPPVVLLHGAPFSSYIWTDIARALSGHFTVYVWDLVGYGQREQRDGQDVSLAAQGRIFAALLDDWGLDAPSVVGHDFGGTVALRALLLEGSAYSRLVLGDAVALAPWGTGFFRVVSEHVDVLARLPDPVQDGLVRGHANWPLRRRPTAAVVDRLAAPWRGPEGKAALYRQIVQNEQRFTDELEPHYGDIAVPTLVLWGEHDQWVPIEDGRELAGLIPGARFRVIPDTDHLIQHDAPAAVAVEIATFLSGQHERLERS